MSYSDDAKVYQLSEVVKQLKDLNRSFSILVKELKELNQLKNK